MAFQGKKLISDPNGLHFSPYLFPFDLIDHFLRSFWSPRKTEYEKSSVIFFFLVNI